MGSYSYLTISDCAFFGIKNGYDTEIANLLFHKQDYTEEKRLICERNKGIWGNSFVDEKGTECIKAFRSTVKICLERLGVFGFTKEKAKKDFEGALSILKEEAIYEFSNFDSIDYEYYLEAIKQNTKNKI